MNNKYKRMINNLLIIGLLLLPFIAKADSGLDSNYEETQSLIGSLISSLSSIFSFIGQMLVALPETEDYATYHIIFGIICLLIIYPVTCVEIFKIDNTINKNGKKIFKLLSIALIPTILFGLICFLTILPIAIYLVLLLIYILVIVISTNVYNGNRLKKQIKSLNNIDKDFDEEEFNNNVFKLYKDIQEAWMNFEIDKVKTSLSKDIYDKYKNKLNELKSKNQKNILDKIEYKSNKIKQINIIDNTLTIECELNVTCIDYIIENDDKVVRGKKDKIWNYKYILVINKKINSNKLVLTGKKMKEQK